MIATLRRRRVPSLPAAAVTVVAAVMFITWTRFGDTSAGCFRPGATLSAAGDDLDAAWRVFQDVKAPAPVDNGFIVATAIAIWLLAFVADWAAFRARAAFEALLPATTLFLFSAAARRHPVAGCRRPPCSRRPPCCSCCSTARSSRSAVLDLGREPPAHRAAGRCSAPAPR